MPDPVSALIEAVLDVRAKFLPDYERLRGIAPRDFYQKGGFDLEYRRLDRATDVVILTIAKAWDLARAGEREDTPLPDLRLVTGRRAGGIHAWIELVQPGDERLWADPFNRPEVHHAEKWKDEYEPEWSESFGGHTLSERVRYGEERVSEE